MVFSTADGVMFRLSVAWEHPSPSRKWLINCGELVLDFAKEKVWKGDELILQEKGTSLR